MVKSKYYVTPECLCVSHFSFTKKIYPIFYISCSSVRRLTGLVLRITTVVPMLRFENNTDASLGKYAYLTFQGQLYQFGWIL